MKASLFVHSDFSLAGDLNKQTISIQIELGFLTLGDYSHGIFIVVEVNICSSFRLSLIIQKNFGILSISTDLSECLEKLILRSFLAQIADIDSSWVTRLVDLLFFSSVGGLRIIIVGLWSAVSAG